MKSFSEEIQQLAIELGLEVERVEKYTVVCNYPESWDMERVTNTLELFRTRYGQIVEERKRSKQ